MGLMNFQDWVVERQRLLNRIKELDAASPKIEYYWRDGTFDALEELRTKEFYNRKYGNGRSM